MVQQKSFATQPTKGAGMLQRAVRCQAFARILGGRYMECAYYFVDGTWNVPSTLRFLAVYPWANGRLKCVRTNACLSVDFPIA